MRCCRYYALSIVLCCTVCKAGAPGGFELSVSGQHRARYELVDGPYDPQADGRDQVLALRTNVLVTAAWPRLRFVGEVMDSRAELDDASSALGTSVVDTLEPVQAYLSWNGPGRAGARSTFRVGRLTLDLGKRRLLARNRYRNTVNAFTGVDWSRRSPAGGTLRAFYLLPMQRLPAGRAALLENGQQLDAPAKSTQLWGAFYSSPASPRKQRLELYGLELRADRPGDERRLTTVGARVYRTPAPGAWHYEAEAALQGGRSTGAVDGARRVGLEHDAYFGHLEIGYRLAVRASPDIELQYDVASGDRGPNDLEDQRFDTLYGARRFDYGPTGIYGPFARANLETPGLRLTFDPAPRWDAMVACRSFRLQSASDAWTTTGLRDGAGGAGESLGRQIEARFRWAVIAKRLGLETGFAYFSKGAFVERTAPSVAGPSRYFYAAVTASF